MNDPGPCSRRVWQRGWGSPRRVAAFFSPAAAARGAPSAQARHRRAAARADVAGALAGGAAVRAGRNAAAAAARGLRAGAGSRLAVKDGGRPRRLAADILKRATRLGEKWE